MSLNVSDLQKLLDDLERKMIASEKHYKLLADKVRLLDDITVDHENRLDDIEKGDYNNRLDTLEDYNRAHS